MLQGMFTEPSLSIAILDALYWSSYFKTTSAKEICFTYTLTLVSVREFWSLCIKHIRINGKPAIKNVIYYFLT